MNPLRNCDAASVDIVLDAIVAAANRDNSALYSIVVASDPHRIAEASTRVIAQLICIIAAQDSTRSHAHDTRDIAIYVFRQYALDMAHLPIRAASTRAAASALLGTIGWYFTESLDGKDDASLNIPEDPDVPDDAYLKAALALSFQVASIASRATGTTITSLISRLRTDVVLTQLEATL